MIFFQQCELLDYTLFISVQIVVDLLKHGANFNLSVPTNNRFEILSAREPEKGFYESGHNNSQSSRQDFINSSIDDKLVHMFDELKFIRNEQVNCSTGLNKFQNSLAQVDHRVAQVVSVKNEQTELFRALAYKSINLEARSRRYNLIFRGIPEVRNENCFTRVGEFLETKLDIDTRDIYMARANRLRTRAAGKNLHKRLIIVNFRNYGDVEDIMSQIMICIMRFLVTLTRVRLYCQTLLILII